MHGVLGLLGVVVGFFIADGWACFAEPSMPPACGVVNLAPPTAVELNGGVL